MCSRLSEEMCSEAIIQIEIENNNGYKQMRILQTHHDYMRIKPYKLGALAGPVQKKLLDCNSIHPKPLESSHRRNTERAEAYQLFTHGKDGLQLNKEASNNAVPWEQYRS